VASLYLPDWNAEDVISLNASLRPGPQALTKVDTHTISFHVGDITYIPIPGQIQDAVPGLLTLQLPQTIREGQRFTVDVQQHAGPTLWIDTRTERQKHRVNFSRRHVLGAFRVEVIVRAGEPLLRKLVRQLAVLRYVHQAIPTSDAWYPVFTRYLAQLADQVAGLGVDPSTVPATADDPGLPGETSEGNRGEVTGKVHEVIFDCFGDFEGFVLETCDGHRRIEAHERGVAEIVLRACRERCTVTVHLGGHGLRKIIIQC
jgi:hypothetical protein